jgi:hypothetical protein
VWHNVQKQHLDQPSPMRPEWVLLLDNHLSSLMVGYCIYVWYVLLLCIAMFWNLAALFCTIPEKISSNFVKHSHVY